MPVNASSRLLRSISNLYPPSPPRVSQILTLLSEVSVILLLLLLLVLFIIIIASNSVIIIIMIIFIVADVFPAVVSLPRKERSQATINLVLKFYILVVTLM